MSKDTYSASEYQAMLAGKKPKAIPAPKPVKVVSPKQQMDISESQLDEAASAVTINKKAEYAEYNLKPGCHLMRVKGVEYLVEVKPVTA